MAGPAGQSSFDAAVRAAGALVLVHVLWNRRVVLSARPLARARRVALDRARTGRSLSTPSRRSSPSPAPASTWRSHGPAAAVARAREIVVVTAPSGARRRGAARAPRGGRRSRSSSSRPRRSRAGRAARPGRRSSAPRPTGSPFASSPQRARSRRRWPAASRRWPVASGFGRRLARGCVAGRCHRVRVVGRRGRVEPRGVRRGCVARGADLRSRPPARQARRGRHHPGRRRRRRSPAGCRRRRAASSSSAGRATSTPSRRRSTQRQHPAAPRSRAARGGGVLPGSRRTAGSRPFVAAALTAAGIGWPATLMPGAEHDRDGCARARGGALARRACGRHRVAWAYASGAMMRDRRRRSPRWCSRAPARSRRAQRSTGRTGTCSASRGPRRRSGSSGAPTTPGSTFRLRRRPCCGSRAPRRALVLACDDARHVRR